MELWLLVATIGPILLLQKSFPVMSDPLDSAAVAQTNFTAEDYGKIKSAPALSSLWVFGHPREYFYISMGSEHMYRSYHEILIGRPAANEDELKNMNLRINFWFSLPSYKVVTEADSVDEMRQKVVHTLNQDCTPDAFQLDLLLSGFSRGLCVPTFGSTGVRTDWISSSYDKIVWQSRADHAFLITRYVNNSIVDWKLLSLAKVLPQETQKLILDKVKSLGLIV